MVDGPFVGSECTALLCSRCCKFVIIISVSFGAQTFSCFYFFLFFPSFQKYTWRTLRNYLQVGAPISFTQLKWSFNEHFDERSPRAGRQSLALCFGTRCLWVGRWWEERATSLFVPSSPLYMDSLITYAKHAIPSEVCDQGHCPSNPGPYCHVTQATQHQMSLSAGLHSNQLL